MYNLIHSIVQNDSYKICKYTKQPYTLYIIRNPTRYISYQTKLSVTSEIRPLLPSQLPVHWPNLQLRNDEIVVRKNNLPLYPIEKSRMEP